MELDFNDGEKMGGNTGAVEKIHAEAAGQIQF